MGEDSTNAKTWGFSHLFDWNKRSKKKLFGNEEIQRNGKQSNRDAASRTFLVNDDYYGDDDRAMLSTKRSNRYSSALSLADEDLGARKAPGLVARLMGLDTLPSSTAPAPQSSPVLTPRSSIDGQHQDNTYKFDASSHFNGISGELDMYLRKPAELKCRKMPSSPVEKFGIEILPPRSTRTIPINHSKFLSPVRNPRLISPDNAADVMEAAARMYELGLKRDSNIMARMEGCLQFPLNTHGVQEGRLDSPSPSRHLDTSSNFGGSNVRRNLESQHINKSWNVFESASVSSRHKNSVSADRKGKGKSILVTTEAKVYVPKKDGPSTRRSIQPERENGEIMRNQRLRNRSGAQLTKMEKRIPAPGSSGVLKQNDQKQNSMMNKGKFSTLPSPTIKKVSNGANRDIQHKVPSKRKTGKGVSLPGKEPTLSGGIKHPGHKRVEVKNSGLHFNYSISRQDRKIQSNIIIDECLNAKQDEDSRGSMDVVSFTFTSPLTRSLDGNWPSDQRIKEKQGKSVSSSLGARGKGDTIHRKARPLPVIGVNVIHGDSMNDSFQHIFHKVVIGSETAHSSGNRFSAECSSSGDWLDVPKSSSTEIEVNTKSISCLHEGDNTKILPVNGSTPFVQQEGGDCRSCIINTIAGESDQHLPSPFSILEACFSGESCESSDSCSAITGQEQDGIDSVKEFQYINGEREIEEASSFIPGTTMHGEIVAVGEEIDYVRDVLSTAMLQSAESIHLRDVALDPHLYDQLEIKKSNGDKVGRLNRKLLFDCISECLNRRCQSYLSVGLQSWLNDVQKDRFTEEIHKDIMVCRSMEGWMVDELVNRDFCSHLGKLTNLGTDASEIGVEIQDMILAFLIDETLAELHVQEAELAASSVTSCWNQECDQDKHATFDSTCWNQDLSDLQDYCLYCL